MNINMQNKLKNNQPNNKQSGFVELLVIVIIALVLMQHYGMTVSSLLGYFGLTISGVIHWFTDLFRSVVR